MSRSINENDPPADRAAVLAALTPGDVRTGRVSKVVPFGVFVRIDDGVDGLLHASEYQVPPAEGDTLTVRILAVDAGRGRCSLAPADQAV